MRQRDGGVLSVRRQLQRHAPDYAADFAQAGLFGLAVVIDQRDLQLVAVAVAAGALDRQTDLELSGPLFRLDELADRPAIYGTGLSFRFDEIGHRSFRVDLPAFRELELDGEGQFAINRLGDHLG